MDYFVTPVECIGVSLVREGDLISLSYIYDVGDAPDKLSASLDLFSIATQIATILNVPLILEGSDGE